MRIRSLLILALLVASAPTDGQTAPGFLAEVYPPTHPERFGQIATWFRDTNFLGLIGEEVNPNLALPRPIRLAAGECGEVNAFYRPDASTPAVVICYEMLEA